MNTLERGVRAALHRVKYRVRDESGNAIVEFVGLALLVLIPLVYLVLTLGAVQAASYAADTAARESTRILASTPASAQREKRIEDTVRLISQDYGVRIERRDLTISCSPGCDRPGSTVTVRVSVPVGIPGLGFTDASLVSVSSSHSMVSDGGVAK